MPSLKDLRNRIESVKSTRKITKAMQMVAAAKLRRAQEKAEAARPYAREFASLLSSLIATRAEGSGGPPLLAGTGSDKVQLLVVMTSERGLCGGLNAGIAKLARAGATELVRQGKTVKILTVGKKGRDALKRDLGENFVDHINLGGVRDPGYREAEMVARQVTSRYDAGEFDVATIFFARFVNVMTQQPLAQQIIPAEVAAEGDEATKDAQLAPVAAGGDGMFSHEPDEEELLAGLLPRGVVARIHAALLENGASEQGARMTAMDNATRNAGEMIDRLTIQFNRSRQAVITNELIEIISGAEAL